MARALLLSLYMETKMPRNTAATRNVTRRAEELFEVACHIDRFDAAEAVFKALGATHFRWLYVTKAQASLIEKALESFIATRGGAQ